MQKLFRTLIFYIFYDFLFQGEIECELYWKQSPRTCKNFAELVSSRASYNINWCQVQVN